MPITRHIGQEVFKMIVEMAYEMEQADKVDLWCIDRVAVSKAVASRRQTESLSSLRHTCLTLERDPATKRRLLIAEKDIWTPSYRFSYEGYKIDEWIEQVHILGSYKYSEKRALYDDICGYLVESQKSTQSYELRKNRAKRRWNDRNIPLDLYNLSSESTVEYKYLLSKVYNEPQE